MFRNSFRILAGVAVCFAVTLVAMQPAALAQGGGGKGGGKNKNTGTPRPIEFLERWRSI